jgi:hypothetical protein
MISRLLTTVTLASLCACTSDSPPAEARDRTGGETSRPVAPADTGRGRTPADPTSSLSGLHEPDDAGQTTTPADLIDPDIPAAIAGQDGWNYHRSASADFDGDGATERAVLTARVEMYRGRPAWDDGQPWQVYVEAAGGGARTYLYAQRLQLGTLTMRITAGADGRPPTIVLLEHLPHRLSVYEAAYAGPDSADVVTRFQREVDPRGETASTELP